MKSRLLAASAAFACAVLGNPGMAAAGPAPPVVNYYGSWLPVSIKVPVYRRVFGFFEVQPTFQREHHPQLLETQLRPGLGFQLNKHWSAIVGAFWSPHFEDRIDNERMMWEQITYTRRFGKLTLSNQFRPEQIRRDTFSGISSRLRNRVKMTYDLGSSPYYAVVSDEPFYNFNTVPHGGPAKGVAENRLFVGVGKKINRFTKLEVGYMNQYKFSRNSPPDKSNHVLFANLIVDFCAPKPAARPQYKLAHEGVVASVPQVVMSDFYTPAEVMFSSEHSTTTALHPALAGLSRARSL